MGKTFTANVNPSEIITAATPNTDALDIFPFKNRGKGDCVIAYRSGDKKEPKATPMKSSQMQSPKVKQKKDERKSPDGELGLKEKDNKKIK